MADRPAVVAVAAVVVGGRSEGVNLLLKFI